MIENRTRCWNYLYPNISHLFLLSRFTLSFVIADHKFDVSFMRRHESNNCFQKMGIRLILMIAERRIRKTSTKENKILYDIATFSNVHNILSSSNITI